MIPMFHDHDLFGTPVFGEGDAESGGRSSRKKTCFSHPIIHYDWYLVRNKIKRLNVISWVFTSCNAFAIIKSY